jgi:hypothetical protein
MDVCETVNAEVGVIVLKKGILMALKSGPEHSSNGPRMMAAMENSDPVGKASYVLVSKQDGNTAGKRIKDGLKK